MTKEGKKVQKQNDGVKRHTQGLFGKSGCGPPGGAPLGEKRSFLLMREQLPLSFTPGWINLQFIPQVQFPGGNKMKANNVA